MVNTIFTPGVKMVFCSLERRRGVRHLRKKPRDASRSVFVDDELQAQLDQWGFLASMHRMPVEDIELTILQATGGSHPLDVTFMASSRSAPSTAQATIGAGKR